MTMATERETHMWWIVHPDSGLPTYAEGRRCTPENPGHWWFPTVGYSLPETRLTKRAEAEREAIDERLQKLAS
jgi:hypothetical protein